VLSFAQWRVLRKAAGRAGGWIPANMLAWMAGMPLIFWGIDAAQKGPTGGAGRPADDGRAGGRGTRPVSGLAG
jgi:hypothetical protein